MSDAIERLAIESLRQAADEITRLRAENDSLLGMVVDVAEYPDGASHGITLGELIAKHQAEVAELRAQIAAHNKCCAGEWVKVTERLPETSNRYTVMVKESFRDGLSGIYTREMSFVRGTWRHQQVNSTNPVVTVTHWLDARMPGEETP